MQLHNCESHKISVVEVIHHLQAYITLCPIFYMSVEQL